MKRILICLTALGGGLLLAGHGFAEDGKTIEERLSGIDAVQAVQLGNEWKWTRREITSYVTPAEVVFEIPPGMIKRIPLPEDRMLVAVAPYIRRTHR